MPLSHDQKLALRQDGFVRLPGVVPMEKVHAALKAINSSLSRGIHPDDLPKLNSQSFCPELIHAPEIATLYNGTEIPGLVESAIGPGRVQPVDGGQIALRFPNDKIPSPPPPRAHIDGMYSPNNGVPQGKITNFTAIVGVFLSEVPGDFCGNFTVWPGSHDKHSAYFRQHGGQALLKGMPPVDIGPANQLRGRPGDAVFVHYLLGHAAASNVSPNIRYACFFRLKTIDHESRSWDTMTDPWLDWPGMQIPSPGGTGPVPIS